MIKNKDTFKRLLLKFKLLNCKPQIKKGQSLCSINKIAEKRKPRKKWQQSRLPSDKTKLNKAIKELTALLDYFFSNLIEELVGLVKNYEAAKAILAANYKGKPLQFISRKYSHRMILRKKLQLI